MVILIVLIAMVVLASVKALQGTLGEKVEFASSEVGAVTTESGSSQRQRARMKRAREHEATGGDSTSSRTETGSTPKSSSGEGGLASVADSDGNAQGQAAAASKGGPAPEGGCGGFNPFLIPIALGLFGLLGYVVLKSQKG
jgi:hypothetical protein